MANRKQQHMFKRSSAQIFSGASAFGGFGIFTGLAYYAEDTSTPSVYRLEFYLRFTAICLLSSSSPSNDEPDIFCIIVFANNILASTSTSLTTFQQTFLATVAKDIDPLALSTTVYIPPTIPSHYFLL